MVAKGSIISLPLEYPDQPASVCVIVVPDFTRDGPSPDQSQIWINAMMRSADRRQVRILRFEYQVTMTGHSIWRQLNDKGEDLLLALIRMPEIKQIMEIPTIWIGNGLGGLIVKRALTILFDSVSQFHKEPLLKAIAGVIFFGTPHVKSKGSERWHRLSLLLGLSGKLPKRFIALSEDDVNAAAVICEDFEKAGLEATVISIFETKPTKVKSGWFTASSVLLVDKIFAETWAKKEKLLGIDCPHDSIQNFNLWSESIQQEIGLLWRSAISMQERNARTNVIRGMSTAEEVGLWEDSISQFSVDHKKSTNTRSQMQGTDGKDSSEDVQPGTSVPSNFDIVPSNELGEYVEIIFEQQSWPCHVWNGFSVQRNFFGRDDIFQEIDACFLAFASERVLPPENVEQIPCCCVSGLGGIGKTQTVVQYAWSRKQHFDAIFFMQAENAAKLSDTFYKIAPALGMQNPADSDEDNIEEIDIVVNRSQALKWLSSPRLSQQALKQRLRASGGSEMKDPNWLLIFDNVEDPLILRDYWPLGNIGCILITTRDARMTDLQSRVTYIHLDKLETQPASQLFLNLSSTTPTPVNRQDATTIANKIGRVPLAIEHVAAYISRKGMALKEFLALYDKILVERQKGSASSGTWSYDIAVTWALDSLSDSAGSLLRVYSFLDPDGMQDSLIIRNTDAATMTQSLPDHPEDELSHIDARRELLRSSLIKVDMEATPVVVRMHRLVQDIAIAEMSTGRRSEIFAYVTTCIFSAWPFTPNSWDHQAGLWPRQDALLRHVIRLAHLLGIYAIDIPEISIRRKFIELLASGGWFRREKGDFDSGIPLFELGIRLCTETIEDCLDLRADLSFVFGGAYDDTNQWSQFMVHVQDQLKFRLLADSKHGNKPNSKTAIAYSELGLAQLLHGQYEDAIKNADTALHIYAHQADVIEGSYFPAFPHFHRSLALVGAGRPGEGRQGLLDLISWLTRDLGPGGVDFKLGYAWQCLGLIYARENEHDLSITAYRTAFTNYQATVGMLFHRTGNVAGKIAEYHESLKQYDAADFYFNIAYKAYTNQRYHKPELARHHYILSQASQNRGDQHAAAAALQSAETLYKEVVHQDGMLSTPLSLDVVNSIVAPWVW